MIMKLLILLGAVIALSEGAYIKKRVVKAYCAKSWTYHKDNCYFFSTQSCNRAQAAKACRGKGASLVKISSKGEGIWLSNKARSRSKHFNKSYWIFPICVKSYKYNKYGGCRWNNGGLKFRGWGNRQPGKGNCAALDCGHKWAYWKSRDCSTHYLYICKKPAFEKVDRPVLIIDAAFPADSSSESSGSGSNSGGSKKGRKSNSNSSGGSKKGKKYKKKGRKYRKRGGSSNSSGRKYRKKGRKYNGNSSGGSKKSKKYKKKGRKYRKRGGSSNSSGRKYRKKGRKYNGNSSGASKKGKKYRKKGRGSGSHGSGGRKRRRHYKKGGKSSHKSTGKKSKRY